MTPAQLNPTWMLRPTVSDGAGLIGLGELEAAAARLRGVAHRTPLLVVRDLEDRFEDAVFVKPEMLQRTGAFKFRGAYNFISQLSAAERARGVIAPSSGNHAKAVAEAARMFGIPCTVVMPVTVTSAKRAGVERLGATIVLAGTTTIERSDRARDIASETGALVVPPFDHEWIIAGQGTTGLEIAEDLSDVGTVIVPVGGGGLSSGVAAAIKLRAPSARVIVVEPSGTPKYSAARVAGHPVTLDAAIGLPDGLLSVRIGDLNFRHLERFCDEVVQVRDESILPAMRFLLDRMKLVSEPSGAAAMAVLLDGTVTPRGKSVVVLSGGNIEWDGLVELLSPGEVGE